MTWPGLLSGEGEPLVEALTARLRQAGCVAAEDEARLIVDHVCEVGSADPSYDVVAAAAQLAAGRAAGDRLEYLMGWTRFAGLRIEVVRGVFVPRWQTETLAEVAVAKAREVSSPVVLDLFTGTGAIACVVADRVPSATVVAGELDPVALACAARNAARFGLEVHASDVDAGIPTRYRGTVAVLSANVPYVPTREMSWFATEWAGEPASARDGGQDGLRWVAVVASRALGWLRDGGWLMTEISEDQQGAAKKVFERAGLRHVEVRDDADGVPCVIIGQADGEDEDARREGPRRGIADRR